MSAVKSSYYYTDEGEQEESEEESEDELEDEESEESPPRPPPLPKLVADRYSIAGEIGSGSYSEVYLGTDEQTGEQVAIKVEWDKAEKGDKLLGEGKFYEELGKSGEAPHIRWIGTQGEYNMMVMDLLGPSIDMYFKHCGKFSLKTVLLLAPQIIDRLEYVHSCGLLYRDIKPHNFLMGLGEKANRVYIVDFGLAKKYIDKKGEHIKCSQKKKSGVTGTVRYSSVNVHEGLDASRRDDLEATGYMLIHLLRGDLPWLGLKAKSKRSKHKAIGRVKMETSDEDLCRGYPKEFCDYLSYCRKLGFDEKPDYAHLRDLFSKLFDKQEFKDDGKFDWTNVTLPPPKDRKSVSSREVRKAREAREKAEKEQAEQAERENQAASQADAKARDDKVARSRSRQRRNERR
eukprot:TRINITY_DN7083_c2_g1_i1.p1 TRINITY_DN7083_c2_g1~~TRINITY_DN7083_c2_g1_i1.p1  ORF type:complete len:402 (+),score=100.42 TRINITY_DN7083_c2_g1_i1:47-1252(+)